MSNTVIYETFSAKETAELAAKISGDTKGGEVFCLTGDLGTGKTAFAKGFAKGLGITEPVSSPTFTIVQIYDEGRLPLYHFDVYRIEDPEEMYETGFEDYFESEGVCLVEWGEMIRELLPKNCISILIEKDLDKGFDYRKITITQELTSIK